jgi:hypothetical protein
LFSASINEPSRQYDPLLISESDVPPDIPRMQAPKGDKPASGILHLGVGAFFRAHGAIYIAGAMVGSGGDWGITGVSLMRPIQRDLLKPQGFAYTAVELGPTGKIPRIVNVLNDILVPGIIDPRTVVLGVFGGLGILSRRKGAPSCCSFR